MATSNTWRKRQHDDPFDVSHLACEGAERQMLAGLLDLLDRDPDTARGIVADLEPAMLQGDGAADILLAIRQATAHPTPTVADVAAALRRGGNGQGTEVYSSFGDLLNDLIGTGPQAARLAREAAEEVRDTHARRQAIEAARAVVESQGDPTELAALVRQLERTQSAGGPRRLTLIDCVDAWAKHESTPVVPTGCGWFDGPTEGGLPIGGITALVAYPQVGKSALALQLAIAALLHDHELRAVWALGEMTPQALARRAACVASTMLDGTDAVTMAMAGSRHAAARGANAALAQAIGDRLSVELAPLTMDRIEQAVVQTRARLLVIDYVQLIRGTDPRADRVAELDGIIGRIRELAITRECAVIAISSMAKAAGTTSRIGQLAKGTGEIDYAVELLYVGQAEERDGKPAYRADGTIDVTWHCRKARNLEARDLLLEFDGTTQTYGMRGFDEFSSFEPR